MSQAKESSSPIKWIAVGAAILIAVVAVVLSGKREAAAREALIANYGATIDSRDDRLAIALNAPDLTDLVEVAPLLAQTGDVFALDLSECQALISTTGIAEITSIESLIGIDLPVFAELSEVNRLPRLRELIFIGCPALSSVSDLRGNAMLSAVDLSGSTALAGSLELSALPSLTDLTLSQCTALTSLKLGASPQLHALFLDGCASLERIEGLPDALALTDIDLSNTHALKSLTGLETLPQLQMLDIRNTAAPDALEVAGKCAPLQIIRLGGHADVTDFSALSGLTNLTELNFDASSTLTSLDGLPTEKLVYCGVPQCAELTDISAIATATQLVRLDLSGCPKVNDITPLSELKRLEEINVTDCRGLRDIEPLASMPALAVLQVGGSSVPRALVARLKRANPDLIVDWSGANTFDGR